MRSFAGGVCLILCFGDVQANDPILQITRHDSTLSIELSLQIGEDSAADAWTEFLDRWFTFFDFDRNDYWNTAEILSVPGIPNIAEVMIRPEVPDASANQDSGSSRAQILAYYQKRSVKGMNLVLPTDDTAAIRIGETLWKLLDINEDKLLSTEELATAPELLNRWDLDENEQLEVHELPTDLTPPARPQRAALLAWGTDDAIPIDSRIPIRLNSRVDPEDLHFAIASKPARGIESLDEQRLRFVEKDVVLIVNLAEASVRRIVVAQQFLRGEIENRFGSTKKLSERQIRADASLEWLVPMLAVLDANQDHALTESEIDAFVQLLAEGAAAQVTLVTSHRGRNLFDLLDQNADGRLSQRELDRAADFTTSHGTNGTMKQTDVPISLNVVVQRGPTSGRFGRLRMSRKSNATSKRPDVHLEQPRWFVAMDRNRDGNLSKSEFIGSPTRFEEMDRNADGMIAGDELGNPVQQ